MFTIQIFRNLCNFEFSKLGMNATMGQKDYFSDLTVNQFHLTMKQFLDKYTLAKKKLNRSGEYPFKGLQH